MIEMCYLTFLTQFELRLTGTIACMYSVRRSGDSYEALASASPRILQLHDNHDILQDATTS